jgi:hypothetical protein
MKIPVTSFALRKLRQVENYISITESCDDFNQVTCNLTHDFGQLFGVYKNTDQSKIFFATNGIMVEADGAILFKPYTDLQNVVREGKAMDCDSIRFHLRSGEHFELRVDGKDTHSGTHDRFALMMFFDAVLQQMSADH